MNRPMIACLRLAATKTAAAALWIAAFLTAALLLTDGPAARAQEAPAPKPPGEASKPAPGAPAQVDRSRDVDFLFAALKSAPDGERAKLVESRILALWLESGSDTADLLMSRVKAAIDGKDVDLGLRLLDAIIELQPGYAEAWNRRATLYFTKKDYGQAIADIRQTLVHEPRHFGAWAGLGLILHELDDDKNALAALRRALELHPYLPRIPELVKTLTEKVEGRDI